MGRGRFARGLGGLVLALGRRGIVADSIYRIRAPEMIEGRYTIPYLLAKVALDIKAHTPRHSLDKLPSDIDSPLGPSLQHIPPTPGLYNQAQPCERGDLAHCVRASARVGMG